MRPLRPTGHRPLCALAAAFAALWALTPEAGASSSSKGDALSCQATAVQVDALQGLLGHGAVVLGQANEQLSPCESESEALLGPLSVASVDLEVIAGHTRRNTCKGYGCTVAQGLSLGAEVGISGLIQLQQVFSRATVAGKAGKCVLRADSFLSGISILGAELVIGAEPRTLHLPLLGVLHLNHTEVHGDTIVQRAVWFKSSTLLMADVVLGEAVAGYADPRACKSRPHFGGPDEGWLTGGGWIKDGHKKVTFGTRLECDPASGPNQLQLNWPGHSFHLESLEEASCDLEGHFKKPNAPGFDTHEGQGTGRLNGVSGFGIEWVLHDAGEPGRDDHAWFRILDPYGAVVLEAEGHLKGGNLQAHW